MSKFCANCGNMMNDADMVCGACGMPYSEPAGQQNGFAPDGQMPGAAAPNKLDPKALMQDPKVKKFAPIVGIAVAAVVAIIIVVSVISAISKSAYEKPIKNVYKAFATGDYELFADSFSTLNVGGNELDEDDWEEDLVDSADEFEEEYGEFKSVKLTVKDVKKCSDSKIKKLYNENADEKCDLDKDDITAAKEVKVKVEVIGEDDTEKETITLYVFKEGGKWKVFFDDQSMLSSYYNYNYLYEYYDDYDYYDEY